MLSQNYLNFLESFALLPKTRKLDFNFGKMQSSWKPKLIEVN